MINFSLKPLSEKYFICGIIGLIITNIIGSVVIPAHFMSNLHSSEQMFGAYFGLFVYFFTSYIFAIMGIFYPLAWSNITSFSAIPPPMTFIFLILSIISIPFTLKLSDGIKIYKRIIYAYTIHIEILVLFMWWSLPDLLS